MQNEPKMTPKAFKSAKAYSNMDDAYVGASNGDLYYAEDSGIGLGGSEAGTRKSCAKISGAASKKGSKGSSLNTSSQMLGNKAMPPHHY